MNQQPNNSRPSAPGADQLAPVLSQFQQAWQTGSVPEIGQYLTGGAEEQETWDADRRFQLLQELIKIDLQFRWQGFTKQADDGVLMSHQQVTAGLSAQHWFLEDYLQQYPELGTIETAPLDLVLAEYQVRHLWGDRPTHREYLQRFPIHDSILPARLTELDAEQQTRVPGDGSVSRETVPHYGQAIMAGPKARVPALKGRFGDYELTQEIARGGMGVVYKAQQISLDRTVALKMILSGQLAGEREVRRFHVEAEAAAKLQHPHIVAIHEVGELEGQHYFSMDFIEGESLAHRVARGPLPVKEAAELVNQVTGAIEYAHQAGILHRDLKPQNILLDQSGQPWVTDFGLARRIEGGSELTGTGQVLGTPSYMPPEQAAGKLAAIGTTSDVYSLGAILYELLTGRPPFRAESALETLIQVLEQEPVSLRLLNATIPIDLETITLKCLQKDQSKRYATAAELSEELVRYAEGKPIQARPVGTLERSWRWCKRKPALAGMWALAVVLLLTFSIAGPLVALHQAKLRSRAVAARKGESNQRRIAVEQRVVAEEKQEEATRSAAAARRALKVSQRQVYLSDMLLAQRDWADGDILHLQELLERHQDEADLQGFEWHYWNRLCQAELTSLQGHQGDVHAVAISSDGKRIASASADKSVKIWDTASGQQLQTLEGHDYPVFSVAFSPAGDRLVSASMDTSIIVWDVATGKQLHRLLGHRGYVMSVAFSPDAKHVLSGGGSTVKLWDAESGQERQSFSGHTGLVHSVAITADGKQLASGSSDGAVKVWDAETGNLSRTLNGHSGIVHSVAFAVTGTELLSAGADGTIRVWDLSSGETVRTFSGHSAAVQSVACNADGTRAVSASADRTVKIWDVASGQQLFTLKGHSRLVRDARFSPDGQWIVSAGNGVKPGTGMLKTWDAQVDPQARTLPTAGYLRSIAFAPDGKRFVSGGDDRTAKVCDSQTMAEVFSLEGHQSRVESVAFSPIGDRIATAGDSMVKLWDSQTGQLQRTLTGHQGNVFGIAFSADGERVASGSRDKTIRICNSETGRQLLLLSGHEGQVNSVAFSPDGNRLASAGEDKTVRLWDLSNGTLIWTASGHSKRVRSVAISSGGERVVSGGDDKSLKVWDIRTGQELRGFKGEYAGVYSVVFSPDGKRLASGHQDAIIRLWDLQTGQETLTLGGHRAVVAAVAFSPDGQQLGSGSWDKTIKIWDARQSQ